MFDNDYSGLKKLPQLREILPEKLLKIKESLEQENNISYRPTFDKFKSRENSFATLKSMDEIAEWIFSDRLKELNYLNILYFIRTENKEQWDLLNNNKADLVSEKIWLSSFDGKMNRLYHQLVVRLIKTLDRYSHRKWLPESLQDAFRILKSKNKLIDDPIINIGSIIIAINSSEKIAELSYHHRKSPRAIFDSLSLPAETSFIDDSSEICISLAISKLNNKQVFPIELLIQILLEQSDEKRPKLVDQILVTVKKECASNTPLLINWLQKNFGLKSDGWDKLSHKAKICYREWVGASSYEDFIRLVNFLTENVDPGNDDIRRLTNRTIFWSHYTNSFERIRILVPTSIYHKVREVHFSVDVEVIISDNGEETEICIFDFGDWFVIEFFRGQGEVRICKKTDYTEDLLFSSNQLKTSILRSIPDIHRHDHKNRWQYFCIKWLYDFNIQPNDGIDRFKVTPSRYVKFTPGVGMPEPEPEEMQIRKRQLDSWNEKMNKLEDAAKVTVEGS
jgi:hypothetical protein